MMDFVQVAEEEGEEPIELPAEEDGTLLLSTLQAQFPSSCGLKYRSEEAKTVRGVRSNEGRFYPPSGENSWGSHIFFCVFPKENKRKSDDNLENSTAKTKRIETRLRCTDLIVLGLPWKTNEDSLREYFEGYGEVLMAQVKKDMKSGQSKGFGFIRFGSYEAQMRVLSTRHLIDGRWCEVKVPNSKGMSHQVPCKVFVGRCTEDITADDLRDYFSKFGEVTDVFIPRPFRAFSFVTFMDPEVAQSLCGEDHIIKGVSVHVSNAAPKSDQIRNTSQNHHSFNYNASSGGNGMQVMHHQSNNGGGRMPHQRGASANNIDENIGMNSSHNGPIGIVGYGVTGSNYNTTPNGVGGYTNTTGSSGSLIGNSRSMNRQETSIISYNHGSSNNYMNNNLMRSQQGNGIGAHNSLWNNQQNRGPLDMPNLQALGINPQGANPSNQSQNLNNALGVGLNLSSLPMNPAIVAAALNQWSILGNQLQNQPQEQGGNFLSWMAQTTGVSGTAGNSNTNGVNGKCPNNSNNVNQSSTSSNCNESQQSSGVNPGNQGWSRQNNSSIAQGATEKSNFL